VKDELRETSLIAGFVNNAEARSLVRCGNGVACECACRQKHDGKYCCDQNRFHNLLLISNVELGIQELISLPLTYLTRFARGPVSSPAEEAGEDDKQKPRREGRGFVF
jgi:hypothetical protein